MTLDDLNSKAAAIIRTLPSPELSGKVRSRLSANAMYQFGFRGFLPSQDNNSIVGAFFCGLTNGTPERYFVCVVPPVGQSPKPAEYQKGDCFDISSGQLWKEDIDKMMRMLDDDWRSWLECSIDALVDFVEVAVRTVKL